MTYRQIEASREARLWIGQVIVPVCMTVATIMSIPEARATAKNAFTKVKDVFKTEYNKVKEL